MFDTFYPEQGQNVFLSDYGQRSYSDGYDYGYGSGYGGGSSRDYFKSDPEILVDFFFSKFADDGADPSDDSQVRENVVVPVASNCIPEVMLS